MFISVVLGGKMEAQVKVTTASEVTEMKVKKLPYYFFLSKSHYVINYRVGDWSYFMNTFPYISHNRHFYVCCNIGPPMSFFF